MRLSTTQGRNRPRTGRLLALPLSWRHAALAQSAERFTRNEQVVGSIPTGGSRKLAHNCLVRAIRHAESGDHVRRNVAALVKPPPGQAGRPSRAMTADQAAALLRVAEGDDYLDAYVILSLTTGIRTEEARALRWDHVSLDGEPGDRVPPNMAVWRSVRAGSDTKTERSGGRWDCRRVRCRRCGSSGSGRRRPGWRRASCGRITAWSSPAVRVNRWTTRMFGAGFVHSVRGRHWR